MKTKRRRHVLAAVAAAAAIVAAPTVYNTMTSDAPTFPDATTTGVPSGTSLTSSGSITVTTPGAVIDRKNITGNVNVKANNVTVKRSRLTSGGIYQVRIYSGFTGTVVEDSELVGTANGCSANVYGSNYTLRRVNAYGCADGLKIGSNVTIEDSYIHDQRRFTGSHPDAGQSVGGSNVIIRRNRIDGPYRRGTSALLFQTSNARIDNVLVENNLLSGGSYTVYFKDKGNGYGPPTNVRILANQFVRGSFLYGVWTVSGNPVRTGNVYDDGQPV